MTTLRQPYYELSPEVYSLVQAKNALEKSTLDPRHGADYLRVSANKWLCILPEMHSKALRKAGVNR